MLIDLYCLQVFAPTDDAFAALNASVVEFLTSPEGNTTLTAILTYHVIPSVIPSVAIPEGTTEVASFEGTDLSIVKSDAGIRINDAANVVLELADVLAINGIVHVIDAVLLIPEETDAPSASPTTMAPTASPVASTAAPTSAPISAPTGSPSMDTSSPTMESGAHSTVLTLGAAAAALFSMVAVF